MRPADMPTLPAWARYRTYADDDPRGDEGDVMVLGSAVQVEIDADAMYPALLEEYRAFYVDGHGDLKGSEWEEALEELRSGEPSAYWLEVVYQTGKMDVQRVAGFALGLHVKHSTATGKDRWRQASAPEGRDVRKAASGGPKGGREARQHYKRLRGFLVA